MAPEEVQHLVIDYAQACGLDPVIAFYQIQRESGFRERAIGSSGEKGIAQFIPDTWARFGQGAHDNAFNPAYSMNAYCRYMTYLLGLFGGDYEKALIGYNGGEGHLTDPGKHGPPSARAKAYAREILAQTGSRAADIGTIIVTPGGFEQTPSWLAWAGLGLIAIVVWSALSD